MELFYIVFLKGTDSKEFVQSIYRNSVSTSSDIGDAIAIKSLEDAQTVRRLIIEKTNVKSDNIKIFKEITTSGIIED